MKVAGVVTHRQRPSTADGVTFLNLEDETGLVNVICSRSGSGSATGGSARDGEGDGHHRTLERVEGVINLVAFKLERSS